MSNTPIGKRTIFHGLVAVAIGLPMAAEAQIEELVVTAQKRSESVQSIPIAINALSGNMMNALGVKDTDDIEKLFPNLSTNDRSAVASGFTIRGVGTNNFHISGKQSVGTNIDGVAAFSPFVSTVGVYDMDRVEVLRGPQNTLYGRNTTGGVINFHTRQANVADGFNGKASLNLGNGGLTEFEGAVGFALSDTLAARVAMFDNNFDGTWTNLVDGSDYGENDKSGGRIHLSWDVSDLTNLGLTLSTGEANGDQQIKRTVGNLQSDGVSTCTTRLAGEPALINGVADCWLSVVPNQVAGSDYLTEQLNAGNTDFIRENPADSGATYLVNYSAPWGSDYISSAGGYNADYDNMRFTLTHNFENMELNLLSSYDELDVTNINIYGGLTGFQGANDGDWEVWQHELRLTSTNTSALRWMTGLYYTTEDSIEDTWVTHTEHPAPPIPGAESDAILIDSEYEGWSVYGQLDYDFTETLSLTAGMRYTDDKLEGQARKSLCSERGGHGVTPSFADTPMYDRAFREAAGCDNNGTLITNNPVQELSEIGWKLGLNWNISNDVMAYVSASEGFKGGAYDNRAQANGENPIGPEFLTAYEIGLKSEFFDRTLQLNGAIYIYDWQDLQQFSTNPVTRTPQLENIPGVDLKGMELEVKWVPTDTLYVQAGIGLSDNEISDITAEQQLVVGWEEGWEVTNAPDTTANVLIVNTVPLDSGELDLQLSYRYMSDFFFRTEDPSDLTAQSGDHGWLNARVTYNFGTELQHSVALWGNNLTEEKSLSQMSAPLPGAHNIPGVIRDTGELMWGLSLTTSF